MKASATVKQADAQESSNALCLLNATAASEESPKTEVTPTSENAHEMLAARPIEARKLRTC